MTLTSQNRTLLPSLLLPTWLLLQLLLLLPPPAVLCFHVQHVCPDDVLGAAQNCTAFVHQAANSAAVWEDHHIALTRLHPPRIQAPLLQAASASFC
jgi:hypothetical protein